MAMKLKRMVLCKGRHDMPSEVQEAIFDCEVNPLDPNGLLREVIQSKKLENIDCLILYVTGLTVALVAVMNACKMFFDDHPLSTVTAPVSLPSTTVAR